MRVHVSLLLTAAAVAVLPATARGQSPQALPNAFRRALDAAQPGWHVAPVTTKTRALSTPGPMTPEPNVLVLDFDGNGLEDRAVLISYEAPSGGRHSQVVALLASPEGIHAVRVGDPREEDPNRYLYPRPRATKLMDLETNREFVCEHDAIGVHYWCCGCTTFLFTDRGILSYWTCD